jgi:hypothetical protein
MRHCRVLRASRSHGAGVDTSSPAWHSQVAGADACDAPTCWVKTTTLHFLQKCFGCPLLVLFDKIVRDLKGDSLSALINIVLEDARTSSDVWLQRDALKGVVDLCKSTLQ